jgi:hypothetical protein
MPYDSELMWQLSFPMPEEEAASHKEKHQRRSCRRTQWHDPIPQILAATLSSGFWLSCS